MGLQESIHYVFSPKEKEGNVILSSEPSELKMSLWMMTLFDTAIVLDKEFHGFYYEFRSAVETYKELLSNFNFDIYTNNCKTFGENFRSWLSADNYRVEIVSLERLEYSKEVRELLKEVGAESASHDFTLLMNDYEGWLLFPSATVDEELLNSFWRGDYFDVLEKKFKIEKRTTASPGRTHSPGFHRFPEDCQLSVYFPM